MTTYITTHEAGPLSLDKEFVAVADSRTNKVRALFGKYRHDDSVKEEQEQFIKAVASAILFSISKDLLKHTIQNTEFNYINAIKVKAFGYLTLGESIYKDYPIESIKIIEDMIVYEVLSQTLKSNTQDNEVESLIQNLVYINQQ
ncbi:hypothetical protein SAMN05192566_0751 [Methylophilus rhizosphaerae]|uniref:Uncharacterized protein n=1 Tax=Methylophilus rhizosphaerae TaxID=492660 RepID=A0A1G9AB83_9PROT|nr:hypothetical protein [Methylophilus rhizosphaerae]SDK23720.1 hypothetical protein SAMN05192566_0751 [Methylophilus rhizosphaerae]